MVHLFSFPPSSYSLSPSLDAYHLRRFTNYIFPIFQLFRFNKFSSYHYFFQLLLPLLISFVSGIFSGLRRNSLPHSCFSVLLSLNFFLSLVFCLTYFYTLVRFSLRSFSISPTNFSQLYVTLTRRYISKSQMIFLISFVMVSSQFIFSD